MGWWVEGAKGAAGRRIVNKGGEEDAKTMGWWVDGSRG